jgi:hypothetical protein
MDLAVRLIGQSKERDGAPVLLLCRRQAGGDKKPSHLVNGDPAWIRVKGGCELLRGGLVSGERQTIVWCY